MSSPKEFLHKIAHPTTEEMLDNLEPLFSDEENDVVEDIKFGIPNTK